MNNKYRNHEQEAANFWGVEQEAWVGEENIVKWKIARESGR